MKIDNIVGMAPSLETERHVAATLLLELGGQIGGRTVDYWIRARDMAQQRLWLDGTLVSKVESETKDQGSRDDAFEKMLNIVTEALSRSKFNPYYQATRDESAINRGVFRRIEADIVMVLDKRNAVIAFIFADAFRSVLSMEVQEQVTKTFEMMSTLYPVPWPDMTRHGLHWVSWLAEHPEFDFRRPQADLRLAKSGA